MFCERKHSGRVITFRKWSEIKYLHQRFYKLLTLYINIIWFLIYRYYPDIYNISGYMDSYLKYGDLFSYQNTSRAKIFNRDAGKIQNMDDMIRMMRFVFNNTSYRFSFGSIYRFLGDYRDVWDIFKLKIDLKTKISEIKFDLNMKLSLFGNGTYI